MTFDDVYTQIEQLGAVTGHVADAAEAGGRRCRPTSTRDRSGAAAGRGR